MKIDADEKFLPVYEALSSNVRLKIIKLLSEKSMNIKEIATCLGLSSAIVTMHINKLEKASIVVSNRNHIKGGIQKLCTLNIDNIEIEFPKSNKCIRKFIQFDIPVGHYTDFSVLPTCGLATSKNIIGYFDEPRYFLDTERMNASILWFTKGFVEYKIPNYILSTQEPEEIEISMEIGSEAPSINEDWPSDISFFFDNVYIGKWTSIGDFGNQKGKYTPSWWSVTVNQYGMIKVIRINKNGTYIDGEKISNITIKDIDVRKKHFAFRLAVLEDSEHVGGLTIFGKDFGNYNQDIIFKLYYV